MYGMDGMTAEQYADYVWAQPPEIRNKVSAKEKTKDQILKGLEVGLEILSSVSIPGLL